MGRPFYPHEADDPDLDWLVSTFLCERPNFVPVESPMLPLMLLPCYDEDYQGHSGTDESEQPVRKLTPG